MPGGPCHRVKVWVRAALIAAVWLALTPPAEHMLYNVSLHGAVRLCLLHARLMGREGGGGGWGGGWRTAKSQDRKSELMTDFVLCDPCGPVVSVGIFLAVLKLECFYAILFRNRSKSNTAAYLFRAVWVAAHA